jgi:hypothetical protein
MSSLKTKIPFRKKIMSRQQTTRKTSTLSFLLIFFWLITVSAAHAQNTKDPAEGQFHDDLLDHFVGKWNVSAVAHGKIFEQTDLESAWVMNHQYVRIHLQGTEIVPWLGIPIEVLYFIGYNHKAKRYVVHEVSVFGGDQPDEGFNYASREGNELKLVRKFFAAPDTTIVQRFTWEPTSGSWHMVSRLAIEGKEQEPFLDQLAVPAMLPSAKKKIATKDEK